MTSGQRMSILVLVVAVLLAGSVCGEEGMWPLYDIGRLPFDSYRASGLELEPEDIYNPAGGGLCEAVVRVGASGSFVSKNGLVITNHHVAYGAVQKQSTAEENLIRDGFYAATQAEEIPAIGYNTWVTLSAEDVTERVLAGISDDMDDFERYQVMDRAIKEIIAEAEAEGDIKCRVARMFGGKQFILYRQFQIRDVRIVYVPPVSIGEYGGDIDNWMWPRHTGDFSFLRAYVAPDGSSAEYSEDNVPYQPQKFLPISKSGLSDGDFAMIIGFPGHTSRYASSHQVDDLANYGYPARIKMYRDILGIIDELSANDPEIAIRLASRSKGINNGLKNRLGMLEGFAAWNLLQKKVESETGLTAFLANSPELNERYGGVLSGLDSLYGEQRMTREMDRVLGMLWWPDHVDIALTLHRWALERKKDDIERERGYQDRDSIATREWLEDLQINLVAEYDRALVKYFLQEALDLPEGQRIRAVDDMIEAVVADDNESRVDVWLDHAFSGTTVGDPETRMRMFAMSSEELDQLNDPLIEFAIATYEEREAQRNRKKKHMGASSRLEPKLISAYAEWKSGELYPDANGTMRVNFGVVKGYSPEEGIDYNCFTTTAGVLEKETGADPFIVPEDLKQAQPAASNSRYAYAPVNDVPVNLLTTNDATGGNSGSPVIDGKGNLVGLLFDCNYEGIAADYLFNSEVARSISVDIRYVLFVIDDVYHLDALMDELTLL